MSLSDEDYSTPSERWSSSIRRFLGVRRLNGLRLIRAIWTVSLITYGLQFILSALSVSSYITAYRDFSTFAIVASFIAPFLLRMVEPLLWLLIIRLVLEVCMRVLELAVLPRKEQDGAKAATGISSVETP